MFLNESYLPLKTIRQILSFSNAKQANKTIEILSDEARAQCNTILFDRSIPGPLYSSEIHALYALQSLVSITSRALLPATLFPGRNVDRTPENGGNQAKLSVHTSIYGLGSFAAVIRVDVGCEWNELWM